MKRKLLKLFEYQKFEQNKELQEVIEETLQLESVPFLSDALLGAVTGGKKEEERKEDSLLKKDKVER